MSLHFVEVLTLAYGSTGAPCWTKTARSAGGPAKPVLHLHNGIIPVLQALTRHCFCECFPFSVPKTKIAHAANAGELSIYIIAKMLVPLTGQTMGVSFDKAKVKNKTSNPPPKIAPGADANPRFRLYARLDAVDQRDLQGGGTNADRPSRSFQGLLIKCHADPVLKTLNFSIGVYIEKFWRASAQTKKSPPIEYSLPQSLAYRPCQEKSQQ